MATGIIIELDQRTGRDRINISVPPMEILPVASIRNHQGSLLRLVQLTTGDNDIDISNISENDLLVKVETVVETIVKNIKLSR